MSLLIDILYSAQRWEISGSRMLGCLPTWPVQCQALKDGMCVCCIRWGGGETGLWLGKGRVSSWLYFHFLGHLRGLLQFRLLPGLHDSGESLKVSSVITGVLCLALRRTWCLAFISKVVIAANGSWNDQGLKAYSLTFLCSRNRVNLVLLLCRLSSV